MKALIKQWFAFSIFEGDEKKNNTARLLNVMLIMGIITIGMVLVANFLDSSTPPRNFVIDFCLIGIFLFLRHLLFKGRVQLVAFSTITATFILQVVSIASEGTTLVPATAMFSLLVILTGKLFNLRGIVVGIITSSLIVASLIVARHAGILPTPDFAESTIEWYVFTITFAVTGGLTYYSQQQTQKALALAENEIIDRKRAEAELRKLTRAVEQSPVSIVITGLDGNIEYVNPRFMQVTGYSFNEAVGENPRILKTDHTPPETFHQLWETISQGKEWEGEFVNHKKDGSLYYESATISPITDLNGIPTNYLAVKVDITERKQVENALRISEARFRSLFEQTHDAVILLDLDGKYLTANQRAASMFGISIEELRGDVISDATKMQKYLPRMLAGEEIPIYEILFQKKDGQILPAEMSMELVRDANGNPMHIQALVRDISLRKQAEEQLKSANERLKDHVTEVEILQQELLEQSIRDPLTGLYNRRYLNETLEREIVRARRENDKFSVIISDIDHFKMINDTYGHQVGDQFIVAIANLQHKHTRSSDIVCRYGGEEFLLVLPGTSMDLAVKRAEEIRLKCAELNIQHEGKGLSATMSFGVATYPDNGDDADEIIIKADNAMYQSKQSGRNKVTAWAKDETSSAIKSE